MRLEITLLVIGLGLAVAGAFGAGWVLSAAGLALVAIVLLLQDGRLRG